LHLTCIESEALFVKSITFLCINKIELLIYVNITQIMESLRLKTPKKLFLRLKIVEFL
jgi:hypothetical protein